MDYSNFKQLEFRRKFFKIVGAELSVIDPQTEALVGFIQMKAWKLRDDIRLYTDRTMQTEIVRIKARQIIDFGATYDIFDSATDAQLCSLRRKGFKSTFVRDHWDILDSTGAPMGAITETGGALTIVRRFAGLFGEIFDLVFAFFPQRYDITIGVGPTETGSLAGRITHSKNPILVKMLLDTADAQVVVDPLILIASTAMLSIIDANKNN